MTLVATHLTLSTERADAATTGSTTEVAALIDEVDFVNLEVDEVQSPFNNATGGTFTLSFAGVGSTGPIAYNAAGGVVETAIESLFNITEVTVTVTGTSGDPWLITFLDRGAYHYSPGTGPVSWAERRPSTPTRRVCRPP